MREIKQSNYAPDDKIYLISDSIILNPNTYEDLKEYFEKEFEKKENLKWYKKIIRLLKN